jgi:hypothetical protein
MEFEEEYFVSTILTKDKFSTEEYIKLAFRKIRPH